MTTMQDIAAGMGQQAAQQQNTLSAQLGAGIATNLPEPIKVGDVVRLKGSHAGAPKMTVISRHPGRGEDAPVTLGWFGTDNVFQCAHMWPAALEKVSETVGTVHVIGQSPRQRIELDESARMIADYERRQAQRQEDEANRKERAHIAGLMDRKEELRQLQANLDPVTQPTVILGEGQVLATLKNIPTETDEVAKLNDINAHRELSEQVASQDPITAEELANRLRQQPRTAQEIADSIDSAPEPEFTDKEIEAAGMTGLIDPYDKPELHGSEISLADTTTSVAESAPVVKDDYGYNELVAVDRFRRLSEDYGREGSEVAVKLRIPRWVVADLNRISNNTTGANVLYDVELSDQWVGQLFGALKEAVDETLDHNRKLRAKWRQVAMDNNLPIALHQDVSRKARFDAAKEARAVDVE